MTLAKELENTLNLAIAEARRRRHEFVTLEHLLLALCADPIAARILRAVGCDLGKLAAALEKFLSDLPTLADGDRSDPKQTPAFWRVLQRAAMHVQSSGRQEIDGGNVLVALFREGDSQALYLLGEQGVSRLDVLRFISHGVGKDGTDAAKRRHALDPSDDEEITGEDGEEENPLEAYTVNLSDKAKRGAIDPLIGRKAELERMVQVLCRRR